MPMRPSGLHYLIMLEKPKAYSVSAITKMIKETLEESFYDLIIMALTE